VAPRAGLDRERVLRVAAELADSEGADHLTLGRLALRLGVRTPSLYNHVAGLPDVQRELALRARRSLGARLARAAAGKTRDEAVVALAEAFRAFIKEHPAQYALTVRASPTEQPKGREMQAADDDIVGVALAVLASYGLGGEVAVHAVRALRSTVHGFTTLELAGGLGLPLDADESFRVACGMLVAGLHKLAVDCPGQDEKGFRDELPGGSPPDGASTSPW
jgi:AcrR family transcriptional regulator